MSILEAFAVPHPPILVSGVGKGEEQGAQATLDAYRTVAQRIAKLAPELLIVTTSHGELYRDALRISTGTGAWGDFAQFGDTDERLEVTFDEDFINTLVAIATREGLAFEASPEPDNKLDHGCMVPLYFIAQHLHTPYRMVRIAISLGDEQSHYRMGQCVAQAIEATGRRAVFVASGDLSHRLKEDGPYGFNPAGPRFDEALIEAFAAGDLNALLHFDASLRDAAAECGLNSFIIMAGVLDGCTFEAELLSYEGPWGVGYGIARFTPQISGAQSAHAEGATPTEGATATEGTTATEGATATESAEEAGGPSTTSVTASTAHTLPVRLAFAALGDWLSGHPRPGTTTPRVAALLAALDGGRDTGRESDRDTGLDGDRGGDRDTALDGDRQMLAELRSHRAGAFVSFHRGEALRGCIGTISATCSNVFEEICQNTVSAAREDPRFAPIRAEEVAALSCSVDILGAAEPIESAAELDVRRYGVIVSHGFRRGLLLPDLEGVDTPAKQVAIALQKAQIAPDEPYELERFEVIRYR
jgi:AmmeMemoRadiSam system protein A